MDKKMTINPLTGGLYYKTHNRRNVTETEQNDINRYFNPEPSKLTDEERFDLMRSVAVECDKDEDLIKKLESGEFLYAYDGFEPSGRMHIAQGVMKAINVNRYNFIFIKVNKYITESILTCMAEY